MNHSVKCIYMSLSTVEIWSVVVSGLELSVSILPGCDWWVLVRTINTLHHDLIIRMDKEGHRLTNCSPLNLIIRKQHSVRLEEEMGKESKCVGRDVSVYIKT